MESLSFLASLPQDHFQCSMCKDVFTDPVTTPCGHSFCKACLSSHWDQSQTSCQCPTCHKRFHARPEVSTNTFMEEISSKVKKMKTETQESHQAPWSVKCDVCLGLKLKAQKSCLACVASYCEAHLEPHHRVPSLMRHELREPVEDLEAMMCPEHGRILELFCREEQACICQLCGEIRHRDHHTVSVEEEGTRQKEHIESKKATIQTMIEERMKKSEDLKAISEFNKEHVRKGMEDSDQLFTALISQVQVMQTQVKSNMEEMLRQSLDKGRASMGELSQEITELQRAHEELEELSQQDDHLHLLQTLQALSTTSDGKEWSKVKVHSVLCVQAAREAVSRLVGTFQNETKTLINKEVSKLRKYKASVSFDRATAGCGLVVTEGGKRLKYSKTASPSSSDDAERFSCPRVLGTEGFTSGRHYWEVQVGLRNDWDVGVAEETGTRRVRVLLKPENKFFAIGKRGSNYQVHRSPSKVLHLCPRPRNVGIYIDCEEGRVSFYDVNEKLHIYSFTGDSFTGKMFPYFYLYSWAKKSEALILASFI